MVEQDRKDDEVMEMVMGKYSDSTESDIEDPISSEPESDGNFDDESMEEDGEDDGSMASEAYVQESSAYEDDDEGSFDDFEEEEEEEPSEDDSDEVYGSRQKKKVTPKRSKKGKAKSDYQRFSSRKRTVHTSSDDDEDNYYPKASKKTQRRPAAKKKEETFGIVSDEADEYEDEEDEEGARRAAEKKAFDGTIPFVPPNSIKKDLVHTLTHLGDDTNRVVESIWSWRDDRFLVKWKGQSHREDSWEPSDTIHAASGGRKLDNFIARQSGLGDLEIEARDGMVEGFRVLERVFDVTKWAGRTYYLCKWDSLGYAEATWEAAEALQGIEDQAAVDAFLVRHQNGGYTPCPLSQRNKVTFRKLEAMPKYLAPGTPNTLRPYQLEGVNWLAFSWAKGTNVILADEMGLGKTIQSVSFISILAHEYGMTGVSLLVVPLSTIDAWKREFARWAPQLNVLCYVGDARSRTVQRRYEWLDPQDGRRPLCHVLLTTYELVLKDREHLALLPWRLLMIDEGHRLKNEGSQLHEALDALSPAARILITGTPLQNSLQELYSLLKFLMPKRFFDFDDFIARYGPPEPDAEGVVDEEQAKRRLESLHAILKPHLLRRMKKDVETSLPGKTEKILRVELSASQKELYKLVLTRNYRELAARQSGSSKNVGSLSNVLMELKKVCNHPRLLLCSDKDSVGDFGPSEVESVVASCSKLSLLDQLLQRLLRDGHRVLIFSQMVRMLDILSAYLGARSWEHQRIDGACSNDARRRAIDAFNAPGSPCGVFLLSTRAGGLGINLETADTVVIYDSDWNPQNDLQAMARAHRIGQTRPVSIFRLVSRDTVEETILERAKQKMVLDHLVIQRMDTRGQKTSQRAFNSREELQAILQFGAQNIFKADRTDGGGTGGGIDLDDILSRSDPTPQAADGDGLTGAASEFLGQFHVADYKAPEEVTKPATPVNPAVTNWDDIIPAEELAKIKAHLEDEASRKKELLVQEALLTSISTRKARAKKPVEEQSQPAKGDKEAKTEPSKKPKRPPVEMEKAASAVSVDDVSLGIDKAQTRELVAGLLRFGHLRPEELQACCPSIPEVKILTSAVREIVKVANASQSKGVTFPNGYYMSVAQLRDRLQALAGLKDLLAGKTDQLAPFRIVSNAVKSVAAKGAHRWTLAGGAAWSILDDAHLLVGAWRHGFGEWDRILADDELALGHARESLESPDPALLPKALHLGRRIEYLVNTILKEEAATASAADGKKPAKKEAKLKQEGKKSKAVAEADEAKDQKADAAATAKLRHFFKPVRSQLAFLAALHAESIESGVDGLCQALLLIGSHIASKTGEAIDRADPAGHWRFVTRFWPTEIGVDDLISLYLKIKAKEPSTHK
jgi:chromodomain-helicase-DNA-binding protein 1